MSRKRGLTQEQILEYLEKDYSDLSDISEDDDTADIDPTIDAIEADEDDGSVEAEEDGDGEEDEDKEKNEDEENDKNGEDEENEKNGEDEDKEKNGDNEKKGEDEDNEKSGEEIENDTVAAPKNSGVTKRRKKDIIWKKKRFQGKPCRKEFKPEDITNPPPIRTPLQYFQDYFEIDFFESAAQYTNMYSVLKKGVSMNTDSSELQRFFGINLVMGCIRYPRLRLYWQKKYSFPAIVQSMPRDRFLNLRNSFHLVDTLSKKAESNNKLWKVQPLIDTVRNVCLSLPRDQGNFSIDEQMIPFLGRAPVKQFVKNKPRPVGLKNFVLTSSSGLVLDFVVYQGEITNLIHKDLGLGPAVVLTLAQTLPDHSFVYFDRYFTTIPLLEELKKKKLEGTGTIQTNRVKGIPFVKPAALQRGNSIEHVSDSGIVVVEWKDNQKVVLASTCTGRHPLQTVKRWSKEEKSKVDIPCPAIVKSYNSSMGGVDICDQQMEAYRTWFKTRKWTWKTTVHFLDLAVVNSWFLYIRDSKANKLPRKTTLDLLSFRLNIAESLLDATSTCKRSRAILSASEGEETEVDIPQSKRSKYYNPPKELPSERKRLDEKSHWPCFDDLKTARKCRRQNCSSRTRVRCEKCDVYLCLSKNKNCFKDFHCE